MTTVYVPAFVRWRPPVQNEGRHPHSVMDEWQDGRCAHCGKRPSNGLVEDHDHATGVTRGFLCRSCNILEGFGTGDWQAWRAGCTPAGVHGLAYPYSNPWVDRVYLPAENWEIQLANAEVVNRIAPEWRDMLRRAGKYKYPEPVAQPVLVEP